MTSTVKTGSSIQPIDSQRDLLPRGTDRGGTTGSGLWWAFWSAIGLFLLYGVYRVFVGTPTGQYVDEELMEWMSACVSSHIWAELILAWVSAGSVLVVAAAWPALLQHYEVRSARSAAPWPRARPSQPPSC